MCFHKWSKWGDPFNSETRRPTGRFGDTYSVEIVQQSRSCEKCGIIETSCVRDGRIEDMSTTSKSAPHSVAGGRKG